MKKTTLKLVCVLLIAVFAAGVFTAVYSSAMLAGEKAYISDAVHTYAVVSYIIKNDKGKDNCYIAYNAEGKSYEAVYDNATSKTKIGDTLELYYRQENPEDFRVIDKKYSFPFAIGIILSVFSLIILAFLIVPIAIHKKLVKNGKWAMCKVKKVKKDGKAHRIYCDSSKFPKRKGKPFVSEAVYASLPKNVKESSMTVYYSEKNPNFYYVDVRNFD